MKLFNGGKSNDWFLSLDRIWEIQKAIDNLHTRLCVVGCVLLNVTPVKIYRATIAVG